jgi:hypothetical protein
MWLLSVVVAVSLAACSSTPPSAPTPTKTVTVAAPAPPPPSTPPPPAPPQAAAPAAGPHSAKADIDLPAGTVRSCDPGETVCGSHAPDMEIWEVTTPYDYTVQFIRQQLPIGKEYEGLPWCSQENNGKRGFTQWDWADADTSLVMVIEQTGTVSITHGPDSQGRQGCD